MRGNDDAMDVSPPKVQSEISQQGTHVVITFLDLVAGSIAVLITVGTFALLLSGHEVPVYLVGILGGIITYYFGRTARN